MKYNDTILKLLETSLKLKSTFVQGHFPERNWIVLWMKINEKSLKNSGKTYIIILSCMTNPHTSISVNKCTALQWLTLAWFLHLFYTKGCTWVKSDTRNTVTQPFLSSDILTQTLLKRMTFNFVDTNTTHNSVSDTRMVNYKFWHQKLSKEAKTGSILAVITFLNNFNIGV